MTTADAIRRSLESPNVADQNLEPANLVDVVNYLALSTERVAKAITPREAAPGHDATDGAVASLTEAVMGLTAGACRIADAIESVADAIRDAK